jgi:glycyl-tRNA synthetase alpha subunit
MGWGLKLQEPWDESATAWRSDTHSPVFEKKVKFAIMQMLQLEPIRRPTIEQYGSHPLRVEV